MKTKDYYKTLEINETATENEIKTAYRKLARKYHPDILGLEYTEHFKEINEAYSILGNSQKRSEYDTIRRLHSYANPQNCTPPQQEHVSKTTTSKTNFNTFWKDFINAQKAKEKYASTPEPINGSDITTDLSLSIAEAINGSSKKINILHTKPCPFCNGRKFANGGKCNSCEGKGYISEHKKLTVKIPAGVKHGYKIRIAGEGNQGANGGKNGNLYLLIKIENKTDFKYDGINIIKTVPITPAEAVLGTTIELPTPNGIINIKILPNTNSGQKLRVQGQGLSQNGKSGDLIVTIEIKIPYNISEEEKELYRKLAKLNQTNIRKAF